MQQEAEGRGLTDCSPKTKEPADDAGSFYLFDAEEINGAPPLPITL
jgi:hypothetical protein